MREGELNYLRLWAKLHDPSRVRTGRESPEWGVQSLRRRGRFVPRPFYLGFN